jgi:hypothetical protein
MNLIIDKLQELQADEEVIRNLMIGLQALAPSKTRAEVSSGGRKPQTRRACPMGSIRSPQWRGVELRTGLLTSFVPSQQDGKLFLSHLPVIQVRESLRGSGQAVVTPIMQLVLQMSH